MSESMLSIFWEIYVGTLRPWDACERLYPGTKQRAQDQAAILLSLPEIWTVRHYVDRAAGLGQRITLSQANARIRRLRDLGLVWRQPGIDIPETGGHRYRWSLNITHPWVRELGHRAP